MWQHLSRMKGVSFLATSKLNVFPANPNTTRYILGQSCHLKGDGAPLGCQVCSILKFEPAFLQQLYQRADQLSAGLPPPSPGSSRRRLRPYADDRVRRRLHELRLHRPQLRQQRPRQREALQFVA